MDQPLYDIFFGGQLVQGTDPEQAKQAFAQLFKSSPEKIEKFFTGKPLPLKRGVDKAAALKYKSTLHKAGMIVVFRAHEAEQPQTAAKNDALASATSAEATQAATPSSSIDQTDEDWSLAPVGSDVLKDNERQTVEAREIDTSAIKMVSSFMEPEAEEKPVVPAPDTSHISAAPVGEDLLIDRPAPAPPLPIDTSDLDLAPPGSDLEQLKDDTPEIHPDTSALSVAAAGAELLEGQQKPAPPPAPDTDHIGLAKPPAAVFKIAD